MKRAGASAIVAISLLVQAALARGLLASLPPDARVLLAAVTLVMVPGYALLELLDATPPGGAWLAPGWALGLGVAWSTVLISVLAIARVPFLWLATLSLPATALLWAAVLVRRGATPGRRADPAVAPLAGVPLACVVLAALGALVYAARFGTPLYLASDSPDHVGTLRRMLEHGRLFPSDAFFQGAGAAGVDPRKFLWHGVLAVIARLSGVDPLEVWRSLPTLLSPLLVLNFAVLGALLSGGAGAAIAAWAALLTYGGSLSAMPMRETVFATRLADQLALATAAAALADLARADRGARAAAVLLAVAAVATHVFAAFQFALVFGALALALWIRDRGAGPAFRRLLGTAVAIGLAVLPFVVAQVLRTPPPRNPIHLEPQGLLTLWDRVSVVSPGVLWEWMGLAWVLFPLLAVRLWREGRGNPAALYLLSSACAAAAVMFLPPAVAGLEPRIGYLLMRVVWIVPLAGLVAWALPRLLHDVAGGTMRARAIAALELAVAVLVLAPATLDAARVARHAGAIARAEWRETPLPWRVDLEWMDARLPAGSVVLSDPVTSYSVPMLTREHVVTMLDQHSSPSDPNALARLLDARDALDPYGDWSRTREVIERYDVDAIVLNRRFAEDPAADYWTPRAEWFAAERTRLDQARGALERVYDRGDFVIYRVHRDSLAEPRLAGVARPFVAPAGASAGVTRRIAPDIPGLVAFALSPRVAARGDTVRGVIVWRALAKLPPASYRVAVRFDTTPPGGFMPPAFCAKPARKLLEDLRHERYRFRVDHLPVGGSYGVDLWDPAETVRDSFSLVVPRDVAAGDFRVRVRMIRQPHYANFRLSDYFFDDDYYAGLATGWMRVTAERDAREAHDVRN